MSSLRDRPADEPLFGAWALALAEDQGRDAAFRWLARSDEPEARGLRAALEAGFAHAGASRDVLAKGLAHERWGQHAGARAHLLSLALMAQLQLSLTCEPCLGDKNPDLLIARGEQRALVEVRSLTGCGEEPWTRDAAPRRRAPVRPLRGHGSGREKQARRRARVAASERAQAAADDARELSRAVAQAVSVKVDTYAALAAQHELPLVVLLYEDTDSQLGRVVARWGRDDGAWARAPERFSALSSVLVVGRGVADDGACLLRAERLVNAHAARPLPDTLLPLRLAPQIVPGPPPINPAGR
ncbi:MAG: hypothetical protein DRQ55_06365 [Planctomycetota bacterium]|nr:MAG: hypothetical protein DRQ55_06365 [Planctomycetota bacterium]